MAHILAVDDDGEILSVLKTALERDGHQVRTVTGGDGVTQELCRWAHCIILDVMMPGEDGFAVCGRIRELTGAPILFLTARTGEGDVLKGLGLGADDYLVKPFRIRELRARVLAHLRRANRAPSSRMRSGLLDFDLAAKAVYASGGKEEKLPLTKSEYAICEFLACHCGQTFSKEQIYEAVFGFDGMADESAITEHIKNIRAKLRVAGAEPVETVWGIGYRWKKNQEK